MYSVVSVYLPIHLSVCFCTVCLCVFPSFYYDHSISVLVLVLSFFCALVFLCMDFVSDSDK